MLRLAKIIPETFKQIVTPRCHVTDGATQITEDLGKEGSEVMDVWQKMDEGEIDSFADGLKLADKAVRRKEKADSELEAE